MREVDEHRAEQLAKSNKISYHEVSNKTGDGVDELFQNLAQKIWDSQKQPVIQTAKVGKGAIS